MFTAEEEVFVNEVVQVAVPDALTATAEHPEMAVPEL